MIALGNSQISPIADVTYSKRTLRKFSENSVTHMMYVTLHTQASLIAQLVKNRLQCRRLRFSSWVGKIHWRKDRLLTPVFLGFPCGSAGKESACNAGDLGLIPGLGRSPGKWKGYPLQYSGLENSIDSVVRGIAKSWTWLSNFHFLSYPYFPHLFIHVFTTYWASTPCQAPC